MEGALLHSIEIGAQPLVRPIAPTHAAPRAPPSTACSPPPCSHPTPAAAPQDVAFHPSQLLLATGAVDGRLLLHVAAARGGAPPALRASLAAHASDHPCRCVAFSHDGAMVLSGSTDLSLLAVDAATGAPAARKRGAHAAPLSRLAAAGPHLTASGDEGGALKLWDARQAAAAAAIEAHSDYVADLAHHPAEHALLSVSGDGTLAVVDLRRNKVRHESEGDADDELLSVAVLKNGRKVVCGTTSGALAVWSWGAWADCSDRFPGHPESVAALVKLDEETLVTGSSDGLIRVVSVQPNKLVGVLGDAGGMDVERLAAAAGGALLASAGHEDVVRLWDLSLLADDGEGGEEAEEAEEEATAAASSEEEEEPAAAAAAGKRAASSGGDSDSDSDSGVGAPARRKKGRRERGAHRIKGKGGAGAGFFSGLL